MNCTNLLNRLNQNRLLKLVLHRLRLTVAVVTVSAPVVAAVVAIHEVESSFRHFVAVGAVVVGAETYDFAVVADVKPSMIDPDVTGVVVNEATDYAFVVVSLFAFVAE